MLESKVRLIGGPLSACSLKADFVGVVIEGDTVISDRGNLEHPAKALAWRRDR